MNEEAKRKWRGIWIPKEVWLDERISALEKIILFEIDSLDQEKGCIASNEYIAKFCQCSAWKVSTAVQKLIDLGYIRVESFDGRHRTLRSNLVFFTRQPLENPNSAFGEPNAINNKEKHKRAKNTSYSCAERSDEPSTPSEPPVFSLPLNDGTEHGITQTDFDTYKKLYPSVDVMQELRKMYGWLDSNPAKKKTRHGIKRFINGWLSREQDKGKSSGTTEYIPPVYGVEETMRRAMDNSEPDGFKPIGGW